MNSTTPKKLKDIYKKCQELAVPKTIDGKYYILDDKVREAYNKKIREDNGNKSKYYNKRKQ